MRWSICDSLQKPMLGQQSISNFMQRRTNHAIFRSGVALVGKHHCRLCKDLCCAIHT
jgi:hypothetical protein